MTEFAISLCILLVAIASTSGNPFASLSNQVTTAITSTIDDVLTVESTLEESVATAVVTKTAYVDDVTSTVKNVTSQNVAVVEEITSVITDKASVSSCLSLRIDVGSIANTISSNTIDCATDRLANLVIESESLLIRLKGFVTDLSALAATVGACSVTTSSECIISVWTSLTKFIFEIWTGVLAEVGILTGKLALYPLSVLSCGFETAISALLADAAKSNNILGNCIAHEL